MAIAMDNEVYEDPAEETTSGATPLPAARLGARWVLGPGHAAMVALFGGLFVLVNHLPLRATDLWVHVTYGSWILEHGALPGEDPVLALADGMQVVDAAWLSQVVFALVERYAGPEWISHLFALTTLVTFLLLARTFYLQTGRRSAAMIGVGAVLVVGWSRLTTVRPETFAALCFAALLWLLVSSQPAWRQPSGGRGPVGQPLTGWRLWCGVPLLMAAWANLHGSFVCGLAVLGCCFLGRLLEVLWTDRSLRALAADRPLLRWLVLCELGLIATLFNPYGIDLLLHTLWFASNENLATVLEWQPLVILGVGGREFALSWVVLLFVMRHSRRRLPVAHVLLLGLFAAAAVAGVRMLTWYAPIFALVLVPHAADLIHRWLPRAAPRAIEVGLEPGQVRPGRAYAFSLSCLVLIWISFALSPLSAPLLGGGRSPQQLLGSNTPLSLTRFLRENPPAGQLYNPQWWGDWLVYDGPPGLRPFVTTSIHVIPHQVWEDYLSVTQGQAGWEQVLDRYDIKTVILDKQRQRPLTRAMRRQDDWRAVYEDDQAMVFARRPPGGRAAVGSDPPQETDEALAALSPPTSPTGDSHSEANHAQH